MTASQESPNKAATSYPGDWDEDKLNRQWMKHLLNLIEESQSSVPLKRIQVQVEQSPVYLDVVKGWAKMNGSERLEAWKKLLSSSEQIFQEMLPSCVQCGECCRRSSPTLHVEDLELLKQGKIQWDQLVTLRHGEPVHSPFEKKLVFLADERIKVRSKPESQECTFLNSSTDLCEIYADRPVQCRAQACWDSAQAQELATQPYLSRADIFNSVGLLLEMIAEHDRRCAFASLNEAFQQLEESKGDSVGEVLQLLAYEDHFRHFLAEKLNIPEAMLDMIFGRSFSDLVSLFGFRVLWELDGSRCLVPDRE